LKKISSTPSAKVLCLVSFISTLGLSISFPLLAPLFLSKAPFLQPLPGLSPEQTFGVLAALFPLGQFFFGPLAGKIADKHGFRPTLAYLLGAGFLCLSLSAFSLYFRHTFMFAVSRLATGMAEGTTGLVRGYLAKLTDRKSRTRVFSLQNNCIVAGWLMGPPLGSLFSAEWAENSPLYWQPFVFAALFSALALHLFLKYIPSENTDSEHSEKTISSKTPVKLTTLILWFSISFLVTLGLDGFYQFYPAFMVVNAGSGSLHIASISVLLTISIMVSNHLWVNRVKHINRAVLLSGFLSGFLLLIISASQWPLTLYLLCPILGSSIAFMTSLIPSKISFQVPETMQGFLMSLLASTRSLGDALICSAGSILINSSAGLPIFISGLSVCCGMLLLLCTVPVLRDQKC